MYKTAFYGVTAHHVTENFDDGDVIQDRRFPLQDNETALSLERRSAKEMLLLFEEITTTHVIGGKELPRIPQRQGHGWGGVEYATREHFEFHREIHAVDDSELISRK